MAFAGIARMARVSPDDAYRYSEANENAPLAMPTLLEVTDVLRRSQSMRSGDHDNSDKNLLFRGAASSRKEENDSDIRDKQAKVDANVQAAAEKLLEKREPRKTLLRRDSAILRLLGARYPQEGDSLNTKWFLNPTSKHMRRWDILMFMLLFYTAVFTPYEVAFLGSKINFLFVWNRVVDFFFSADLIMQFFLPYYDRLGGRMIYSHSAIAERYLKSWFWVDLLSVVPFDSLGILLDSSELSGLKILRVVRLLRLIKLMRIFKAVRMFARWETKLGISYAMLTCFRFVVILLFLAHWMACTLRVVVDVEEATCSDGTDCNWISRVGMSRHDDGTVYLTALYWSVMTITTIGYGDVELSTEGERVLSLFAMVLGASLYAYVVGAVCRTLAMMDEATSQFHNTMDELNVFMAENDFPIGMKIRLREYFRSCKQLQRTRHFYAMLFRQMSPSLRAEVALFCHRDWVEKIPFFNASDPEERRAFIAEVAMALEPRAFSMNEEIIKWGDTADVMYVINKGVVVCDGQVMTKGDFFGDDIILNTSRRTYSVRSVTFTQVFCLSRRSLLMILATMLYPQTQYLISRARVKLAFRRHFVTYAKMVKQAQDAATKDLNRIDVVAFERRDSEVSSEASSAATYPHSHTRSHSHTHVPTRSCKRPTDCKDDVVVSSMSAPNSARSVHDERRREPSSLNDISQMTQSNSAADVSSSISVGPNKSNHVVSDGGRARRMSFFLETSAKTAYQQNIANFIGNRVESGAHHPRSLPKRDSLASDLHGCDNTGVTPRGGLGGTLSQYDQLLELNQQILSKLTTMDARLSSVEARLTSSGDPGLGTGSHHLHSHRPQRNSAVAYVGSGRAPRPRRHSAIESGSDLKASLSVAVRATDMSVPSSNSLRNMDFPTSPTATTTTPPRPQAVTSTEPEATSSSVSTSATRDRFLARQNEGTTESVPRPADTVGIPQSDIPAGIAENVIFPAREAEEESGSPALPPNVIPTSGQSPSPLATEAAELQSQQLQQLQQQQQLQKLKERRLRKQQLEHQAMSPPQSHLHPSHSTPTDPTDTSHTHVADAQHPSLHAPPLLGNEEDLDISATRTPVPRDDSAGESSHAGGSV